MEETRRQTASFAILLIVSILVIAGAWLGTMLYKRHMYDQVSGFNYYPEWGALNAIDDYAHAHNGRYPDADRWEDEIRPYWRNGSAAMSVLLYTPSGQPQRRLAMNVEMSGVTPDEILKVGKVRADNQVLLYETVSDHKNTFGHPQPQAPGLYENLNMEPFYVCGDFRDESSKHSGCGHPVLQPGWRSKLKASRHH